MPEGTIEKIRETATKESPRGIKEIRALSNESPRALPEFLKEVSDEDVLGLEILRIKELKQSNYRGEVSEADLIELYNLCLDILERESDPRRIFESAVLDEQHNREFQLASARRDLRRLGGIIEDQKEVYHDQILALGGKKIPPIEHKSLWNYWLDRLDKWLEQ